MGAVKEIDKHMTQSGKQRITVQVLNGATGEVREIVANVEAVSEQHAVNVLFERARRDDYYSIGECSRHDA